MSTTALNETQLEDALQSLNGWQAENKHLTKTFSLPSYMAGLAFASAVGTIAEGFDHHPDIMIAYKKVKVSFTTHDAGSQITQKDVDAARSIDALGYPRS